MVKDKFWIGLISGLVLAALASGAAVVAGVSLNYTPKIWPETIDQRPLSDDEINTLAIATDENPNVIRFDFSTAHQSLTLSADVYEYGRLVKPNAYNRTSSPQQASKGTLWLTWKNDAGILGAALGNESS
ncbi:MAG: hypothetical protein LBI99_07160, partial [Propionibacteriaceae bacterium]|nr:hypothetical protein [Propionibacteriaceae bacterium]